MAKAVDRRLRVRLGKTCLLIAAVIAPLVGHGCHKDDVDHEPGFTPPLLRPTRERPPAFAAPPAPHPR